MSANVITHIYDDGRPDSYVPYGGTEDWPPVRAGKARPISLPGSRLREIREYLPAPDWVDAQVAVALCDAAYETEGDNVVALVTLPGESHARVFRAGEDRGPASLRGSSAKALRKAARKSRPA